MKAMDFIDSVVPRGGTYCVVGIKNKKLTLQEFATSLEDTKQLIAKSVKQGNNTYFGLASFKDNSSRKQDNVGELKSFYIDLDCGDAGKVEQKVGYLNKEDAFEALTKFVTETGLPQPTIVDSGGGWHAYWILDNALSREKWQPIATRFKTLCQRSNLFIDPAVTDDSARVLRVPSTMNVSRSVPAKLLDDTYNVIALSQFETPLREACEAVGVVDSMVPEFLRGAVREMDEATKALLGNKSARFSIIAKKSLEGAGCAQIRDCLVNSDTLDEPRWRAVLSVAQVCEDRDDAIHKISKRHPEYSPDSCERKADATKGPYYCSTWESKWPSKCEGCVHKGTNITNPIQFGTVHNFAKTNQVVVPPTVSPASPNVVAPPTTITFPKLPFPYERGVNGGIYQHVKLPDGTDSVELVYENDLFIMKRIRDANDGEVLLFNLVLPMDGLQEFVVPLKHIGSADKLRDALAHHGVSANKKKMDSIMSYIFSTNRELQHRMKREQSRSQFGWHDNDDVFVCGKREISASGIKSSPPSTQTINLAQWLEPKGNLDEWKTVMKVFSRPGWERHQLGALIAFGAPLMKFSGERGLTINLVAEDSGTGKTLIQHFINSTYGHTDYLMLRKGDTIASRNHRFGVMCHLPVCMDEMTNATPDDVSDLVYGFSEGRGRNRLESGANKERVNETWWATISALSSNASMADKLTARKATADAELMRIFEMDIYKPEELDPDYAQGLKIILENNYGIAGEIYLKAIMKDLKATKALFKKVKVKVNKMLGTKSKERFWVCGFSSILTGGYIARKLGLIDWDIDALFKLLITLAHEKRIEVANEALDYKGILGEFLSEHKGAILQINGNVDLRSGLAQAPIFNPNIRVVGRYEPDRNTLYIVRTVFKEYCVRKQIPFNAAVTKMQDGIKPKGSDKIRIMRGTGIDAPAVPVLIFEGSFEPLEEVLNGPAD